MFWIVKLALLLVFGFSLLTHAFFWYETVNTGRRSHLDALSHGRLAWWMCRGVLQGFAAILFVCLLFPFGFLRSMRTPGVRPGSSHPPVILVHGLYHNASGWLLFRWWLRQSGFEHLHAFNYSSFGRSFEEILKQFEGFVREVESRHPGRPFVMLGHSLGGLICRAFADRPENVDRVMAVVTLGSPHRGSKLAALSIGQLGQSLLYGGQLFKDLERQPAPSGSHRLALSSPMDTMVLPAEGLRILDPGWRQKETSPIGHISMLFHKPTFSQVITFLREVNDSRG